MMNDLTGAKVSELTIQFAYDIVGRDTRLE